MRKEIISILIILISISSVHCACDTITISGEYSSDCMEYTDYIAWGFSGDQCILWGYERLPVAGCFHNSSQQFINGYVSIGDTWYLTSDWFYYYNVNRWITIKDISSNTITIESCDFNPDPDPTPTPTPDPTPTATSTPNPEAYNDTYYNTSEDYASGTGMGGMGGTGEIYDSIGEGLGDGGTGMANIATENFNAFIPVIFLICIFIFIAKVSGMWKK